MKSRPGDDVLLSEGDGPEAARKAWREQGTRSPWFKRWFGDWEAAKHKRFLEDEPVVELTGNEFKKSPVPLTKQVAAWFQKEHGGTVVNPQLGEVALDERGVRDSLSHGIGRNKAAAFAAVPSVIEKGMILARDPDWKGRRYQGFVLGAPIRMASQDYVAVAVVHKDPNSQRFYLHEVGLREGLQQDAFKTGADAAKKAGGLSGASAGAIKTLLRGIFGVKSSAVTNPDGTPKVVYHGTGADADFDVFDTTGGNDLGAHFGSRSQANDFAKRSGGRVLAVYLAIKNPLQLPDLNRWDFETVSDALSKHGIKVENSPYRVETADMAENYRRQERRQRENIAEALARAGYDGIVYKNLHEGTKEKDGDSYIVFDPAQIKSATGNRGTFDPANPDIRLSEEPGDEPSRQDPELMAAAARLVAAFTKAGVKDFGEVVRQTAEINGRDVARRAENYLRDAWDYVRERFPAAQLDASSPIADHLPESSLPSFVTDDAEPNPIVRSTAPELTPAETAALNRKFGTMKRRANRGDIPQEHVDYLASLDPRDRKDIVDETEWYATNSNAYLNDVIAEYKSWISPRMAAQARLAERRAGDLTYLRTLDTAAQQIEETAPALASYASSIGNGNIAQGLFEMMRDGAKGLEEKLRRPDDYLEEAIERHPEYVEQQRRDEDEQFQRLEKESQETQEAPSDRGVDEAGNDASRSNPPSLSGPPSGGTREAGETEGGSGEAGEFGRGDQVESSERDIATEPAVGL